VTNVRETNESINNTSDKILQMNNNLQVIQKNFPPYAIDSNERREILMNYISLRKELVSLMVPQPPPPIYEKVNKMWDSLFEVSGQISETHIPALEPDSSDKQVAYVSAQLDKLSSKLADASNSITQTLVNS